MARPEEWTPEQLEHVLRLRAGLPRRPWWLLVKNPKAPKQCPALDGLLLVHHHHAWRNRMPPCDLKGCCCTVWALTAAEAARRRRRDRE